MTEPIRLGETVSFERCGETQRATIIGWDYVSGAAGIVSGEHLRDPRYRARTARNAIVAVCESEIRDR